MASVDHGVAHVHKGQGLVPAVFNEDNLSTLKGEFAIGHTRYSTTGGTGLRNAQPHVIETIDGPLGIAHNGNLVNAHILRRQLLERGVGLQTSSDTEVMIHLLTGGSGDWMNRIKMLMAQAEGAFALTIITRDAVFGVRDPWGFRPLVLGKFEGGYLLASETCAFSAIGAELVHELAPGEICRLDADGYRIEQGAVPKQPRSARSSRSTSPGPTRSMRASWCTAPVSASVGSWLARRRSTPTSSSPCPTRAPRTPSVRPGSGYPVHRGIHQEPLCRAHVHRAHPGASRVESPDEVQPARRQSRRQARGHGRRFDRAGTTSGPLVQMLRDAGASEVHVRVACPAITDPCYMGVDMAAREDLIAANMDVESIAEHIGADSLAFLSIEALMRGLEAQEGYCNACFTGVYPFEEERFVQLTLKTKEQFASVWGD